MPNSLPFCRIGFAVSRKVGNAVVRNRIRRRLRDILRRQLTDSPLHYDLVVVARSASVEAEFGQMQSGMIKIFSRLDNENTVNNNNQII